MKADSKENYIPLSTIYGKPNPDGTYTLTAIDIKNLNDNLYALAKKIQGGLTFADMTKEVNQEYSNIEGDITQVQITAEGLSTRVSNAEGDISTLEQTADGLATRVSSTEQGIITVTNATTGLSSDVAAITTNVSTLEQTAQGLTSEVSSIKDTTVTLTDDVSGLNTDISTLTTEVSTLEQTASSISATVSQVQQTANSAESKAQSVELTVDGFTVTGPGGITLINGDYIKSGTIDGASLVSTNLGDSSKVAVTGGVIQIYAPGSPVPAVIRMDNGQLVFSAPTSWSVPFRISNLNNQLYIAAAPLKLESYSNMSLDADGTVFIGSNGGAVQIGNGGDIRIFGNLYINGEPYVPGGGGGE